MTRPEPPPRGSDQRRLIDDPGANNGDDIGCCLAKGDLVVAVEAGPTLAADLRVRKLAAVGSELLQQVDMRLGSDRMTRWGRKLWGIG